MCVTLETSLGDLTIDLYTDECPKTTFNFLKLCKIKYYNNVLFHNIQQDFIVQTGDPTGTGRGGESIHAKMYGEQARYLDDEIHPRLKHDKMGILGMASQGQKNTNASQFYFTITKRHLDDLDGKHTIFGEVSEGLDVLEKIGSQFCDKEGKPYRNIRILHAIVIYDPFDDPKNLHIPSRSPSPKRDEHDYDPLRDEVVPEDTRTEEEIEEESKNSKAGFAKRVLTLVGDLPHEDVKPPDNVLFVCKLNPATNDEDLESIFSAYGNIISCEVIRDWKTGESLNYAFIEYETADECQRAYLKMNNTLIDDRRIHVDFSQSVSKLWNKWNKGDRSILDSSSKDFKPEHSGSSAARRHRMSNQRAKTPGRVSPRQSTNLSFKRTGRLDPDAQDIPRKKDAEKDRRRPTPSSRSSDVKKRKHRHRSRSPPHQPRDYGSRSRKKSRRR